MSITILLADDHIVVRQGLRSLLEAQPDFEVIGEAKDGLEAVKQVEALHPGVLVLDLVMPGMSGMEVVRRVHDQTHVIILSMHSNEAYVVEALRSGAYGYVLKDATAGELAQAIRTVVNGQRFLSAPFSEHGIEAYLRRSRTGPLDPYETLTAREREVLVLAANGLSNPEIANRLTISPRTAEIHRANMMHKLDLHTQTDLVRYALRRGLVTLEE
ncbi:two component transcriptional regulator, LuxR family [Longilinea arvoryzae]|uniref:Two component transcriptional regulator, LuxR family n=1 Tax=Longilinea arvoryzae TaxID=360412 RepID=A0A0S7BD39_9CHLR|nr:response regulator transcription factor [Longilinea arvoryzae]GAP15646.1 two component transcriptional regulator, LuxR family [Longilinea arvoryzae]